MKTKNTSSIRHRDNQPTDRELLTSLQLEMSRQFRFMPMYEGTVDPVVVEERRAKNRRSRAGSNGKPGRAFVNRDAKAANKEAVLKEQRKNREAKNERIQKALAEKEALALEAGVA